MGKDQHVTPTLMVAGKSLVQATPVPLFEQGPKPKLSLLLALLRNTKKVNWSFMVQTGEFVRKIPTEMIRSRLKVE